MIAKTESVCTIGGKAGLISSLATLLLDPRRQIHIEVDWHDLSTQNLQLNRRMQYDNKSGNLTRDRP